MVMVVVVDLVIAAGRIAVTAELVGLVAVLEVVVAVSVLIM